jgi:hypothetical protein
MRLCLLRLEVTEKQLELVRSEKQLELVSWSIVFIA